MASTPSGPAAGAASHRTSLDGLRALAIVGVMFVHAGAPGFRSGWIGVDLFFVLSGFLITTLLAMESAASGAIAYGPFMARRALRLMPAYFVYAAFITLLIWAWPGSERTANAGWDAAGLTAAIWTYTINFVPQGGIWNGQDLTVHLWSLAVEQQYYLVWPVAILALHSRAALLRWVAVALAVATVASFVLAPDGLYKNDMLYTRGFSLVVASALALWVFHRPGLVAHRGFNRACDVLGGVLLVALAVFPYVPGWPESRMHGVFIPLLVPLFALWIARLWTGGAPTWPRRLLQAPSLVYIGKISYGVYLYHEAVRVAVWFVMKPAMAQWPQSAGFVARMAVYMLVSFALAALSYEFFEKKFLRLAGRFRPARARTEAPAAPAAHGLSRPPVPAPTDPVA
jgi:peptidoglycan/LPS O-acetylase OafA/YrhL